MTRLELPEARGSYPHMINNDCVPVERKKLLVDMYDAKVPAGLVMVMVAIRLVP
jgi:hypothetical protein